MVKRDSGANLFGCSDFRVEPEVLRRGFVEHGYSELPCLAPASVKGQTLSLGSNYVFQLGLMIL